MSQFVDTNSPLEMELGEMEPEDVIRTYWVAVDSGDYARAHACETKTALFRYLFANMDNNRHANESFAAFADGLENYICDDGRETVRDYRVLVNQDTYRLAHRRPWNGALSSRYRTQAARCRA